MKEIQLSGGYKALVDDEDYEFLNKLKWSVWFSEGKKTPHARVIMSIHSIVLGHSEKGMPIDHVDGNGLNNTKLNLRVCNNSQNQQNRKKQTTSFGKPCSSIYKGVCFHKRTGRWYVNIRFNGNRKFVGSFVNEIDAAKAYDAAAIKYHKEYARLNFPI